MKVYPLTACKSTEWKGKWEWKVKVKLNSESESIPTHCMQAPPLWPEINRMERKVRVKVKSKSEIKKWNWKVKVKVFPLTACKVHRFGLKSTKWKEKWKVKVKVFPLTVCKIHRFGLKSTDWKECERRRPARYKLLSAWHLMKDSSEQSSWSPPAAPWWTLWTCRWRCPCPTSRPSSTRSDPILLCSGSSPGEKAAPPLAGICALDCAGQKSVENIFRSMKKQFSSFGKKILKIQLSIPGGFAGEGWSWRERVWGGRATSSGTFRTRPARWAACQNPPFPPVSPPAWSSPPTWSSRPAWISPPT